MEVGIGTPFRVLPKAPDRMDSINVVGEPTLKMSAPIAPSICTLRWSTRAVPAAVGRPSPTARSTRYL